MGELQETLDAIDEHLMLWGFIPKRLVEELHAREGRSDEKLSAAQAKSA